MRSAITGLLVVGMLVAGCSGTQPTPQIVYVTPPPSPTPVAALPSPEASAAPRISFDFGNAGVLGINFEGTVPESANNFCTVDRALSGAAFIRNITFETMSGDYTVKVVVIDEDGPGSDTPPYLSLSAGRGFDTKTWTWLQGRDGGHARWVEPNTIKFDPATIYSDAGKLAIVLVGTVTCTGYLPAE